LCEEIAAEQRARRQLAQVAAIPTVRHVRRVEPGHFVSAQIELLAVGQRLHGAFAHVVREQHGCQLAAQRLGLRRQLEPLA